MNYRVKLFILAILCFAPMKYAHSECAPIELPEYRNIYLNPVWLNPRAAVHQTALQSEVTQSMKDTPEYSSVLHPPKGSNELTIKQLHIANLKNGDSENNEVIAKVISASFWFEFKHPKITNPQTALLQRYYLLTNNGQIIAYGQTDLTARGDLRNTIRLYDRCGNAIGLITRMSNLLDVITTPSDRHIIQFGKLELSKEPKSYEYKVVLANNHVATLTTENTSKYERTSYLSRQRTLSQLINQMHIIKSVETNRELWPRDIQTPVILFYLATLDIPNDTRPLTFYESPHKTP